MDVLHDNSYKTWYSLGTTHQDIVPDYVTDYTPPDEKEASDLEDGLYADDARRMFPMDSDAATWLSAAYFHKNAEELPYKKEESDYVLQRIKNAAIVYGITDDVELIGEALTATPEEKQASDDLDNYGWVMVEKESGDVIGKKYPMFDARGVKKANDYFTEYRARYPHSIRKTISKNIMRKAAEYGVTTDELSSAVFREAGYGIPKTGNLMEEIYERAHLAKDAESAILLANINEMIAGMPAKDVAESIDKIAEVIDTFDRTEGLVEQYNKKILMPADFLYDVNIEKAAEFLDDSIQLDRHTFSLNKLAELKPAVFETALGEWFVDDIVGDEGSIVREKMADALYSLPKPDKAALEDYLKTL